MAELPTPELAERDSSGVFYLTDEALFDATGVRIAFTGRAGGVSKPPFDSLNLATHVGDDPAAVAENRARALAALGAPAECEIVSLNQVHGTRVLELASADADVVSEVREAAGVGADGIAVADDVEGVAALLCFADCVPVILVAPDGTFAVAHAGWRGVMGEIVREAVAAMRDLSPSTAPTEINAYIGPHIRSECFEVSEELAADFAEKFGGEVAPDSRHVDLSAALRKTLLSCGLVPEHIIDANICTQCNSGDFYSYRAAGGECGRHAAIAFRG